MELLTVGPYRLEVEWIGTRGAGPTLVFLHEGLGCVALWRDFPRRVAEACGLPAFVYSRAGYGRSSAPGLPRSVRYMHDEAALLPHVLSAAGVGDAILFGHSDGASIALIYAGLQGQALARGPFEAHGAPVTARVRGLVLEAPHVFAEELSLRSIAAMRDAYQQTDLRARLGKYHRDPDAAFWGWNGPWLHPDFRSWNLEAYLPHITAPVLLVQGEADEYGTPAQLEAIRRGVRGRCETLLLPGVGHSPHKDAPDAVLPRAAQFVRTL